MSVLSFSIGLDHNLLHFTCSYFLYFLLHYTLPDVARGLGRVYARAMPRPRIKYKLKPKKSILRFLL